MTEIVQQCIEAYGRLKHLRLTGEEVGIPWQTVYVHLKKAGIPVTGDKARYGSVADRFAVKAEQMFAEVVPLATPNNEEEYQATIDFTYQGTLIDIKASKLQPAGRQASGKSYGSRWAYCISKQKDIADFFVFYAFDEPGDSLMHVCCLNTHTLSHSFD